MELAFILAACFALLLVVEVYLGGPLPRTPSEEAASCPARFARMPLREFFGQVLPLSAAGIGLPMSVQHPWAIALVIGAAGLHLFCRRLGRAC